MLQFIMLMASSGGGQSGNQISGVLIPMIAVVGIMYFFMLRPQMKKQKQHKELIESVKKGDKIISVGGIIGTVAGVREKDNVIIVKVADNTKIEILKTSVAKVIGREE